MVDVVAQRSVACLLTLALAAPSSAPSSASRRPPTRRAVATGDWPAFGRTVDNNRYSPLTEITPANVDQLGRVYTMDFLAIDPDTRRGQQSYPLAIGGTLYVTTNDANVFAIDGATGKILWQHKPTNSAVFKNFGVAANRGLAYCGGKLFILQLDMKVVALRPSDGEVVGRARDQAGRAERDRRLRLLGDERADLRERQADLRRRRLGARPARLRDGVHDRPEARLADAVLDDPARSAVVAPRLADRRRRRRSGRRSRSTRRRTRSSSAPARERRVYFPALRPGQQPARGLADRRRPRAPGS